MDPKRSPQCWDEAVGVVARPQRFAAVGVISNVISDVMLMVIYVMLLAIVSEMIFLKNLPMV